MGETIPMEVDGQNPSGSCMDNSMVTQPLFLSKALNCLLGEGETWYLVSKKWLDAYKLYVEKSGTNPGPIDNSNIMVDKLGVTIFDETLIERDDFETLPNDAWNALKAHFGLMDEGHEMPRKVIVSGVLNQVTKIEYVPLKMDLKMHVSDEKCSISLSRADSMATFVKLAQKSFKLSEDKKFNIHLEHDNDHRELLKFKVDEPVENYLSPNASVLLDVADDQGNFRLLPQSTILTDNLPNNQLSHTPSSNIFNSSNPKILRSGNAYGEGAEDVEVYKRSTGTTPGVCGLSNMGNTCYMNSGLQCLSHIPELTQYFMDDEHKDEINTENPLGTSGKLALAYGSLMKNMWGGTMTSTIPRQFKNVLGDFCPTFNGYSQQDSQELMLFCVDTLHEDLNRIKNKPYVELSEANGRPDNQVAMEAWDNHRKRNDSVVVDLLHGMLKSTLECPTCDRISVKFDPFCFLPIPVPSRPNKFFSLILAPLDPNNPWLKMKMPAANGSRVSDICDEIKKACANSPQLQIQQCSLVLCELNNGRIIKMYAPDDFVQYSDMKQYVVYPLQKINLPACTVIAVQRDIKSLGNYHSNTFGTAQRTTFAIPIVWRVAMQDLTWAKLRQTVVTKVEHNFFEPLPDSDDWIKDSETCAESSCETSNGSLTSDVNLFELTLVNNFGHDESKGKGPDPRDYVTYDPARPLPFGDKVLSIGVDWHPIARRKYFKGAYENDFVVHESMKSSTSPPSLADCLNLFSNNETLEAGNEWYCPQCKEPKLAHKIMNLWQLPKILIIQLKRFSEARVWRSKIDCFVDFPMQGLNMKDFVQNPEQKDAIYDLIAVSNHMGGMGGGHYTANGLNFTDQKWYHFDDSNASACSEAQVATKYAYVLVYKLREAHNGIAAPAKQ